MDIKLKKEFFIQSIIPCFYFFLVLKFLQGEGNFLLSNIMTSCFVSVGLTALVFMSLKLKPHSAISIIIILLFISSHIISFFSSNYRLEDGVLTFQYFGIALVPVFYRLDYKLYMFINYFIIVFFLYFIISGVAPDDIFSVSRNFVSVLLLIGTGYHIISCYQNDKRPSVLLLLLSLFVTIWSMGRSGIIIYLLLLVLYPFMLNFKFQYKMLYILVIVGISIFIVDYFSDTLFEAAIYRFESMGLEDVRSTMNKDYLDATFASPLYFLIGAPLTMIKSMADVDYNPHNSFIRLHIFYGLFGFLLLVFSIIVALFKYLMNKKYLLIVLFIVFLFRSSVDSTAFHGPLDPLVFFFIFYPLKNVNILLNYDKKVISSS